MAKLAEIKSQLGVTNLELNKSLNQDGTFSGWFRMWNNDSRIQISIHKDTVETIQKNPDVSCLALQIEDKISTSSGKPYTNKRIIVYEKAEIIL